MTNQFPANIKTWILPIIKTSFSFEGKLGKNCFSPNELDRYLGRMDNLTKIYLTKRKTNYTTLSKRSVRKSHYKKGKKLMNIKTKKSLKQLKHFIAKQEMNVNNKRNAISIMLERPNYVKKSNNSQSSKMNLKEKNSNYQFEIQRKLNIEEFFRMKRNKNVIHK